MKNNNFTLLSQLIILVFIQVISTQHLVAQSSTPSVTIEGYSGDNGSNLSGYTDFSVNITQDAQIIFTWEHTAGESYVWDPLGYTVNGALTSLGSNGTSDTIDVTTGDVFAFRFATVDNIIGPGYYTISNFEPGFDGQFAQANWSLSHSNSDGHAAFVQTAPEYCSLVSTRNRFEWIKEVEIGTDISNLSNKDGNGYGDYTDELLTVDTGDVVSVELTPGYRRRAYVEYWRIWVDWNYDGDFDDAGEKVFEQSGKNVRTGSFTVPVNVSPETLMMRVAMRWKRYAPSCGSYTSGEVEDYSILVNHAQGSADPIPTRLAQDNSEIIVLDDAYEFLELDQNPITQGQTISGYIRVEETGTKYVNIVNTLGQIVKTTPISCDEEESHFEISTESLDRGVYFLSINAQSESLKVIVQ